MDAENLAPAGIRSPDRQARSESLYQLSYSGLSLPRLSFLNNIAKGPFEIEDEISFRLHVSCRGCLTTPCIRSSEFCSVKLGTCRGPLVITAIVRR
jgi:hypothetical protein